MQDIIGGYTYINPISLSTGGNDIGIFVSLVGSCG